MPGPVGPLGTPVANPPPSPFAQAAQGLGQIPAAMQQAQQFKLDQQQTAAKTEYYKSLQEQMRLGAEESARKAAENESGVMVQRIQADHSLANNPDIVNWYKNVYSKTTGLPPPITHDPTTGTESVDINSLMGSLSSSEIKNLAPYGKDAVVGYLKSLDPSGTLPSIQSQIKTWSTANIAAPSVAAADTRLFGQQLTQVEQGNADPSVFKSVVQFMQGHGGAQGVDAAGLIGSLTNAMGAGTRAKIARLDIDSKLKGEMITYYGSRVALDKQQTILAAQRGNYLTWLPGFMQQKLADSKQRTQGYLKSIDGRLAQAKQMGGDPRMVNAAINASNQDLKAIDDEERDLTSQERDMSSIMNGMDLDARGAAQQQLAALQQAHNQLRGIKAQFLKAKQQQGKGFFGQHGIEVDLSNFETNLGTITKPRGTPAATTPGATPTPAPSSTPQTGVSVSAAMQLPEYKGKSRAEVEAAIRAHGHVPTP